MNRRTIQRATALLALALLAGCSSTRDSTEVETGPGALIVAPASYTREALCDVLQDEVGAVTSPDITWLPSSLDLPTSDRLVDCSLTDEAATGASLRLTLSTTGDMSTRTELDKALASDDEQCPGGGSQPDATMGAQQESTLICVKDTVAMFAYLGNFDGGYVEFRVARAGATPTEQDVQSWLDLVRAKLIRSSSPAHASDGSVTTQDTEATRRSGDNDAQRIWETCYAPRGSVEEVNSNESVINDVLDAYPSQWTDNAPVPTVDVAGICHQEIPSAGVQDVWWIHLSDSHAGYAAALAWDAQLVATGKVRNCIPGLELENGPNEPYSCTYQLTGYAAVISYKLDLGVELLLQPQMP